MYLGAELKPGRILLQVGGISPANGRCKHNATSECGLFISGGQEGIYSRACNLECGCFYSSTVKVCWDFFFKDFVDILKKVYICIQRVTLTSVGTSISRRNFSPIFLHENPIFRKNRGYSLEDKNLSLFCETSAKMNLHIKFL